MPPLAGGGYRPQSGTKTPPGSRWVPDSWPLSGACLQAMDTELQKNPRHRVESFLETCAVFLLYCLGFGLGFFVLYLVVRPMDAHAEVLFDFDPGGSLIQTVSKTNGGPYTSDGQGCNYIARFYYGGETGDELDSLTFKIGYDGGTASWTSATFRDAGGSTLSNLSCTPAAGKPYSSPAAVTCTLATPQTLTNSTEYKVYGCVGTKLNTSSHTAGSQGTASECGVYDTTCAGFGVGSLSACGAGGYGCKMDMTADGTLATPPFVDPRTAPTSTWQSWPDGQTLSVIGANETYWQIRSNIPDYYTTSSVSFDLGIYREDGGGWTLLYSTSTLVANHWLGHDNPGSTTTYYSYRGLPGFVHSTGTYALYQNVTVDGTTSDFVLTSYTVEDNATPIPEESCPGDAPFYTSCFWFNLFSQAFVPSNNPVYVAELENARDLLGERAPFAWFVDIGEAIGNVDSTMVGTPSMPESPAESTTSSQWSVDIPITARNTTSTMSLDFGAPSGWNSAIRDYIRPLLRLFIWGEFIAYIWSRTKQVQKAI